MLRDKHLVPLKPEVYNDFVCPACGAGAPRATGVIFPGVNMMGAYACGSCELAFVRDLPVGFAVDHPLALAKGDGKLFNTTRASRWLFEPLVKAFRAPDHKEFRIERVVRRECSKVIILNTLDFLYGHVLLKLYNAQHYIDHYPEHGLVVVVPRMFLWLVPKDAAEVWIIDIKLGEAHGWYPAIDAWVHDQLPRYDEVQLGRGYAHPDFSTIDIERFAGIAPFPVQEFAARPPHITFVARTDRLWFASPFGKLSYRALGAAGLRKSLGQWFVRRQTMLIAASMRRIRKSVPGVEFSVVGLAPAGGLGGAANDLRTTAMNKEVELAWCAAYAKSQIVIGVHGSNMLLPTAFAAGLIEILPRDRFGNMVQDVSVRQRGRLQLFLYRFVDEFASPRTVARHAASMFEHFTLYYRNNEVNTF